MKLYWRLLKLDWLDLLCILIGTIVVFGFLKWINAMGTHWHQTHITFDFNKLTCLFYIIPHLMVFFIPWININGVKAEHPLLTKKDWIYTLPIDPKKLYHTAWLKFLTVILIFLAFCYFTARENPDAIISLNQRTPRITQENKETLAKFFPEIEFTEKAQFNYTRPVAILHNGNYWVWGITVTYMLMIINLMLNLTFYSVSRSKTQQLIKWINFGIGIGLPSLVIFDSIFVETKISCQIVVFFQKYIVFIVLSLLSLYIGTYVHGKSTNRYREIE